MYRVEHKDIDSQKFMNAKSIFFLNSRKSMFAKTRTTKKLKTKILILFIYSKRQIWLNKYKF